MQCRNTGIEPETPLIRSKNTDSAVHNWKKKNQSFQNISRFVPSWTQRILWGHTGFSEAFVDEIRDVRLAFSFQLIPAQMTEESHMLSFQIWASTRGLICFIIHCARDAEEAFYSSVWENGSLTSKPNTSSESEKLSERIEWWICLLSQKEAGQAECKTWSGSRWGHDRMICWRAYYFDWLTVCNVAYEKPKSLAFLPGGGGGGAQEQEVEVVFFFLPFFVEPACSCWHDLFKDLWKKW